MREKFEDRSLKPDECTSEESKLSKRKITYTRPCLLSLHDWETCSDLPSDFDSSILQELYDDGSIGTLERTSTECSMSICSSEDSEFGISQSFRCNDQDLFGKFTKWDGHSSWLNNKDSTSKRNSNPDNTSQESSRKLPGHLSAMKNKDGHSTSNQESDCEKSYKDGQLFSSENPDKDGIQIPAFPSVSESTAAVSAPVVQVHYQLKKCDNPYRPPHMYKGKNSKVKCTRNSGKGSPGTSDEQQNKKQSAKQSHDSVQTSESGIRMKNTVNILSSEEAHDQLNSMSLPSSESINKSEVCVDQEIKFTYHEDDQVTGGMKSDQDHEGIVLKELPGCAAQVKSGSSAILSKNHDVEADNTPEPTLHHNKLTFSCIEEEKGSSGKSSGSRNVETNLRNGFPERIKEMESSSTSINHNTRVTETRKPTSGMGFLKESRPHEPAFPIQIGSINLDTGQDISECCGTQDVNDSFLLSILDDSGAFENSGDSFLLSILDDSGAFEMYSEIIKARKASVEPKENEHENEDADYQKIWDKISSIVTTEQESNSSPLALSNGEVDFNELCLPDEDSLITIDDLISPLSLEPLNEITALPLNSTAEVHTQDPRSELSSDQGYTAPPYILPRNNIPPLNPNLCKNTVLYSVLEQPGNHQVQQTELREGAHAAFPDPIKQLGSYNNGLRTTYFYPHNFLQPSYQMFGMPNTNFSRFGGNNSRAIVNGSAGMNLGAGPMHPLGITGYGQKYQ